MRQLLLSISLLHHRDVEATTDLLLEAALCQAGLLASNVSFMQREAERPVVKVYIEDGVTDSALLVDHGEPSLAALPSTG